MVRDTEKLKVALAIMFLGLACLGWALVDRYQQSYLPEVERMQALVEGQPKNLTAEDLKCGCGK